MDQHPHDAEKLRLRERIENARKRRGRQLLELLRQAAALGDTDALVELGQRYQDGLEDSAERTVVRRSEGPALKCFRRAAELGDTNGMILLASTLERLALKQKPSARSSRLFAEAMSWERKALRRGNAFAAFNLAVSYLNLGRANEAVLRFRSLAKAGDEDALLELAKAELYGVGTKRDVAGAIDKLKVVARKGSKVTEFDRALAMLLLASTAYHGWLVRRDFKTVVTWLRRAAGAGSAAAKGMLEDLGDAV